MADRQMSLIPVSPREFTQASFDLEGLLQQIDEEEEAWDEAKDAHKETMAALHKAVIEKRQIVRRHKLEMEEGLSSRQVDALLNSVEEQRQ